jgi:hypothetical protein
MTQTIPKAPLILGLSGLLPFIWGALSHVCPEIMEWGTNWVGAGLLGTAAQTSYGVVILSFMSGVLWGFATKAQGQKATACYAMSVLPALWAFLVISSTLDAKTSYLMVGFIGILILDVVFYHLGLTPRWWLRLRVLLSAIVLGCLSAN